MKHSALFIVSSDPRGSPRTAEAVRIAAGIVPWKRVGVTLCFRDAAVLALDARSEAWQDGETFLHYLPALALEPGALWALENSPWLAQVKEPIIPFSTLNGPRLAALAAGSDYVLNF